MKKRYIYVFMFFFLYILMVPETALASAREGLLLWYTSVLPSLFPFMLICSIVLRFGILDHVIQKIHHPFHFLTGCSPYGAFAIMTGFLCGFPMGAKITSDLYDQKKISRHEADWLMGFVNNLSPGFIISYLACDQMNLPELKYLFPANILGASFLYGILTGLFRRHNTDILPSLNFYSSEVSGKNLLSEVDESINDTMQNLLRLGAYIMIFCIIGDALQIILPFNNIISLLLCSTIEITNGIRLIASSDLSFPAKYFIINVLSSFGGFCALTQSAGIARMNSDTLFKYIKSRVYITLLSMFLCGITILFSLFL